MKIESLELVNFRGIEKMGLSFTQQTTAFVGINGVGKSSVLDALAIALSQLIWRINSQPQKARPISPDDIRVGAEYARIGITVLLRGESVSWAVAKNRRTDKTAPAERRSDLENLNKAVSVLDAEWSHVEEDRQESYDLPLAVYYDVHRAVLEIPMRVKEKLRNNPYEIYSDALDHGGADFKRFFIWFRNREDFENEQLRDNSKFRDRALESVRLAVATFTQFSQLRIRRDVPLRMTVVKNGCELSVAQLSDGEKNMLALVGDLARRLSVLNPSLNNPNDGRGVVLIDEIDLHLHPKWQRTVVASLQRTFPNCQFIISTHSPQVIGELSGESVLLLKDGALLGHAPRALGLSSGEVLEELMEGKARNVEVEQTLNEVQQLIDNDKITDAQQALEQLKGKVGEIPELLQAQSAIDSLKWLEESKE
jgi:predicted ATP-binding protein involved in virulence